jgi:thiosulfate/3-mercaptopyruvate sulfurtransferase
MSLRTNTELPYRWALTAALALGLALCSACSGDEETPAVEEGAVLVSAQQLYALQQSGALILDARPQENYDAEHVKGAVLADWKAFVNPDKNGLMLEDVSVLQERARALGISGDRHVVIYADWGSQASNAGRLFWTLEYLGHGKVHLLNGGFEGLKGAGIETASAATTPAAGDFTVTLRPEIRATIAEVTEVSSTRPDNVLLLDTRTPEEWEGDNLRGNPRGGHVPGAVHYEWTRAFTGGDEPVLRPAAELRAELEALGVVDGKLLIPYCQSGVRSAFIYTLTRHLGYTRIKNYDGSMWEWSRDESKPLE